METSSSGISQIELTHGVEGVEWSHYKHPLFEYVYDVYMRHWTYSPFWTRTDDINRGVSMHVLRISMVL